MSKIGIVGHGYVGKATHLLFDNKDNRVFDTDKLLCVNAKALSDLQDCSLVFVCVPTPMRTDGSCDISAVEDIVKDLLAIDIDPWRVVVRSTVPVGTCERLEVNFMPEFLTEKNWKMDVLQSHLVLFGMHVKDDPTIIKIYDELKNCFPDGGAKQIAGHSTKELELIKLTRNAYLATKVSFFNEIKELCDNMDLDYEQVWRGVGVDNRITAAHTQVPGPDGKNGYGGTCFPKDCHSLLGEMERAGMKSHILASSVWRNENVDRPEKDWENDKGRAVSE